MGRKKGSRNKATKRTVRKVKKSAPVQRVKKTPKAPVQTAPINLTVKCVDCGTEFERSKFTPNQKHCLACAKKVKLTKVKLKVRFKKYLSALSRFEDFIKDDDKFVEIQKKLTSAKTSKRYQFFKAEYPAYVELMRTEFFRDK